MGESSMIGRANDPNQFRLSKGPSKRIPWGLVAVKLEGWLEPQSKLSPRYS